MITVSPVYVAFITGPTLVPVLVGLMTKAHISVKIKTAIVGVVSLVVAAFASFIVPETGVAVISWASVGQFLIVFLSATQGYDKFWKPVVALNDKLLPDVGLGTVVPQETIATVPVEQGVIDKSAVT